jgi:hypothetical protein
LYGSLKGRRILCREHLKTKGEEKDGAEFFHQIKVDKTAALRNFLYNWAGFEKNKALQINLSCATFKHYLIFQSEKLYEERWISYEPLPYHT